MKSNDFQQQSYGARYPTIGFWTSGVGNTDKGYPPHPYETFSFDEALLDAKIQDFNIVPYSSVLPKDLDIRPIEDVTGSFTHGAVLEVIMAGIGVTYSEGPAKANISIRRHGRHYHLDSDGPVKAVAACLGVLTNVQDNDGNIIGGYVAEYVGIFEAPMTEEAVWEEANKQLKESLANILAIRGYEPGSGTVYIHKPSYTEVSAEKPFGYALNAFGFLGFQNAIAPTTPSPPPSSS